MYIYIYIYTRTHVYIKALLAQSASLDQFRFHPALAGTPYSTVSLWGAENGLTINKQLAGYAFQLPYHVRGAKIAPLRIIRIEHGLQTASDCLKPTRSPRP